MEKIKWLLSVLLGLITTFMNQYGTMILLVAFAIFFDFVTGVVKANIKEEVDSKIGQKGFYKKIALLICLFFGFFLDYAIPMMCASLSITIKVNMPFGMIICFYIVLNECISTCENLYECNPRIMPKWIVRVLKSTKKQLEEDSSNDDSETE